MRKFPCYGETNIFSTECISESSFFQFFTSGKPTLQRQQGASVVRRPNTLTVGSTASQTVYVFEGIQTTDYLKASIIASNYYR